MLYGEGLVGVTREISQTPVLSKITNLAIKKNEFKYPLMRKNGLYFFWTQEGPAYTWVFNFHMFVCSFVRS